MRTADLDNRVPLLRLCFERFREPLESRNQMVREAKRARDLHRRRIRVIRTLAVVHVIVGVDGILRSNRPTRALACNVCNHLVHIHVGRSSRTGLEDVNREVPHERMTKRMAQAGRDGLRELRKQLIRRCDNRVGLFAVKFAELRVRLSAALLQQDVRLDLRLWNRAK